MKYLILFLLITNLITFIVFGIDKRQMAHTGKNTAADGACVWQCGPVAGNESFPPQDEQMVFLVLRNAVTCCTNCNNL